MPCEVSARYIAAPRGIFLLFLSDDFVNNLHLCAYIAVRAHNCLHIFAFCAKIT